MSGHAKEPWKVFPAGECHGIDSVEEGQTIVVFGRELTDDEEAGVQGADVVQAHANAARIVACVNAMADIDDPVGTLKELREAISDILVATEDEYGWHNTTFVDGEGVATSRDIDGNLVDSPIKFGHMRRLAALLSRIGGGE